MTTEAKTIRVTPESELDEVLDAADAGPILLDRGGIVYRVVREPEDTSAGFDPERFRAMLDEVAGSWSDLDADKAIDDIHRWREEGSRPADRHR